MSFVSIILLNYNGKKFNKDCIDSILLQSYKNFKIIFVDNASTDGSLEEVEKLYENEIEEKKIIIVKNKENSGFTGGNNLGVKYASNESEYICLLNNDTTVPENWLEELVKGIESDRDLGAVGSLVLDMGYEEKIKNMFFDQRKTYTRTILGETAIKNVSMKDYVSGIYYTTSLSGCSLLYKKNIIKTPFPERYFAYGEDIFFCLTLISKGYKLAFCTKSIVNHYGSGSFGKKPSDFKLFYGNRNQIINYFLFYKVSTIIKLFPLFFITQISQIFINVPLKRIKAKIKSRFWIFKNIGKVTELRGEIQENKIISDNLFIQQLSYKFSDDIHYINFSASRKRIISFVNKIFELYIKVVY